jgi:hypothetical protein
MDLTTREGVSVCLQGISCSKVGTRNQKLSILYSSSHPLLLFRVSALVNHLRSSTRRGVVSVCVNNKDSYQEKAVETTFEKGKPHRPKSVGLDGPAWCSIGCSSLLVSRKARHQFLGVPTKESSAGGRIINTANLPPGDGADEKQFRKGSAC